MRSAGNACPLCSGFPGAESEIPVALIYFSLFLFFAAIEDEVLLSLFSLPWETALVFLIPPFSSFVPQPPWGSADSMLLPADDAVSDGEHVCTEMAERMV